MMLEVYQVKSSSVNVVHLIVEVDFSNMWHTLYKINKIWLINVI